MPLIINGKTFTGELNDELYSQLQPALEKIPAPTTKPLSECIVKKEEAVVCLQREAAYTNNQHQTSNIKYLGVKNINSCFFAYFYTETDHLVVHFDKTNGIDLKRLLKKFDTKDIKLILVGGIENQLSIYTFLNMLHVLMAASTTFNMTVESQLLFERNEFTESEMDDFLYKSLLYQGNILSLKLFGKPLSEDYVTRAAHWVHLLNHQSIQLTEETINFYRAILFTFELYHSKSNLEGTAPTLTHRNYLYTYLSMLNIQSEEQFNQAFQKLFCKELFELAYLLMGGKENLLKSRKHKMENFVIDIHTKTIYTIPHGLSTPLEVKRSMLIYDYDEKIPDYFICYDNNAYQIPTISDALKKRVLSAGNLIQEKDKVDIEKFAKTIHIEKSISTEIYNCFFYLHELLAEQKLNEVDNTTKVDNAAFAKLFLSSKEEKEDIKKVSITKTKRHAC